jgi:hypothetical protein
MSLLPQKKIIQKEVQPMREQYLEELILNVNVPHEGKNINHCLTTITIRLGRKNYFVIYVLLRRFVRFSEIYKREFCSNNVLNQNVFISVS